MSSFLFFLLFCFGVTQTQASLNLELFFKGAHFFSEPYLKTALKQTKATQDQNALQSQLQIDLIKMYKAQGFHFVKVNTSVLPSQYKDKFRLLFHIQEGERVYLKELKIIGDFAPFRRKNLKRKIKSYGGPTFSKGYFSASRLEQSLKSLQNHLYNQGFFEAEVILSELNFPSQSTAKAKVTINTKLPTRLGTVRFSKLQHAQPELLELFLGLSSGQTLNLDLLKEGLELIEDYYLKRGFLQVQVQKKDVLSYSKNLKQANLKINIFEGNQVFVSKIDIKGLKKTKLYVVLNELSFTQGQILNLDHIKTSINKLQTLGLFSNVTLKPLLDQPDENGFPVEITLKERKPGSFVSGFGLNTELDLTAKTFLGLSYKNLGGKARSIGGRLELKRNLRRINYFENKIIFNYTEPYVFKKNWLARFQLSRNDEIWNFNKALDTVTLIESNRLDMVLEQRWSPHFRLFWMPLSLDLRQEKELNGKFDDIKEVIVAVGPSLELDYRDHPFLPKKGSFTRLALEYTSPHLGSQTKSSLGTFDLEYIKMQGGVSFYKPVNKRLFLAQSFRGGYLYNFTSKNHGQFVPFPKSRAFFLGGASTLRGFDPSQGSERIPNDTALQSQVVQGQTLGGGVLNIPTSSHYYLSKTELRFPLAKNSNWWGAVFYDGGSVQIAGLPQSLDPWRHSVGVGLRFNTPVGPLLNLEIAYKLDRKQEYGETYSQIHLSVSSF